MDVNQNFPSISVIYADNNFLKNDTNKIKRIELVEIFCSYKTNNRFAMKWRKNCIINSNGVVSTKQYTIFFFNFF